MNFPIALLNEIIEQSRPLKGIVSIYGDFGVGKTILALQIALIHAMLEESILYIYTKPYFPFEKIRNLVQFSDKKEQLKILSNINFFHLRDFNELNSLIFNLETLLLEYLNSSEKKSLKLIVIDSITDLYRLELNKDKKKKNFSLNYQLNQILATLRNINQNYDAEILLVNDISRKNINNKVEEIQLGGVVMDYWLSYSIKINRTDRINERKIMLTKHPKHKKIELCTFLTSYGFE